MKRVLCIVSLVTAFLFLSCSRSGADRIEGWWLVESAVIEGQQRTIPSDSSFLVGFNSSMQMYVIAEDRKCNGARQPYTIVDNKVSAEAVENCDAKSANFDFDGDKLVLTDVRFGKDLVTPKATLRSIPHSEVQRIYEGIPDGNGDGGNSDGTGIQVTMNQLNGFWQWRYLSLNGSTYGPGDSLPNGSRIAEQTVVNYFKDGKMIQFSKTASQTPNLITFSIGDRKVVVPDQPIDGTTYRGLNFYITEITGTYMWTGPFLFRFSSTRYLEYYRKISEAEVRTLLRGNAVFERLFP